MPTYEFECKKCGKKFEELCKWEERESIKCPCGGETNKLISAPNFTKEDKPFFSHALGKKVDGNKDWKKKMNAKGFSTEMLDPY